MSLRSAQQSFIGTLFNESNGDLFTIDEQLEAFSKQAQASNDTRLKEKKNLDWLELPIKSTSVTTCKEGVEFNIPPPKYSENEIPLNQKRCFYKDSISGYPILMIDNSINETNSLDEAFDYYSDGLRVLIKNLVACWPTSPLKIAESVGIKLKELEWFILGKKELNNSIKSNLVFLLSIEFDERINQYIARGPYIIIGKRPKATFSIIDEISIGGSSSGFEVIPKDGLADPNWRYFVLDAESPSILMIMRGDRIAEKLTVNLSIYLGSIAISGESYREIVSTCARASISPESNFIESQKFNVSLKSIIQTIAR